MGTETINTLIVLLKGIGIGIAASAPVGPVGIVCIQKTINNGRVVGLLTGLGAALADLVYAVIATFSLGYTQQFLIENQLIMQVVGVGVLLFIGFKIFFTNPIHQIRYQKRKNKYSGLLGNVISVFFLTLSNPLTVIFFGASIAAVGIFETDHNFVNQLFIVAGVFIGASLWWFSVTGIVNLFRHKFRLRQLWWINKISGGIIVALTIAVAIALLMGINEL